LSLSDGANVGYGVGAGPLPEAMVVHLASPGAAQRFAN